MSSTTNNTPTHLEIALAALAARKSQEETTAPVTITTTRTVTPAHSDESNNSVTITQATRETFTTIAFDEGQQIVPNNNGDILLTDPTKGTLTIPNAIVTPTVRNALYAAKTVGQARRFAEAHLALQGYDALDTVDPNTLPVTHATIELHEPEPTIPGSSLDTAINIDDDEDDLYETREEAITREKANGEHREIRSLRDIEEEEGTPLSVPPPRDTTITPTQAPKYLRWEDVPLSNTLTNAYNAFISPHPTFDLPEYREMRNNFASFDAFLRLIQHHPPLQQRVKILEHLFDSQRSMRRWKEEMTKAETTQTALLSDLTSIQIRYDQEWKAKLRQLEEFTKTFDGTPLQGNLDQAFKLNDVAIRSLFDEVCHEVAQPAQLALQELYRRQEATRQEQRAERRHSPVNPTTPQRKSVIGGTFIPSAGSTIKKPHFTQTRDSTSVSPAPHTPRKEYTNYRCRLCNQQGHIQWSCTRYICKHCQKPGPHHRPENCPTTRCPICLCFEHGHTSDCPHYIQPVARLRGGSSAERCKVCKSRNHKYWKCRRYQCPRCEKYAPGHVQGECYQYDSPPPFETEPGYVDFGEDGDWNMSGEC